MTVPPPPPPPKSKIMERTHFLKPFSIGEKVTLQLCAYIVPLLIAKKPLCNYSLFLNCQLIFMREL